MKHTMLVTAVAVGLVAMAPVGAAPGSGVNGPDLTRGSDAAGEHLAVLSATLRGSTAQSGVRRRSNGRLVYYAYIAGKGEVFTIDPNGRKQRRLTHNDTYDNGPSWSPNGRRIVYGNDNELFIMRRDGSHKRQLTHANSPETVVAIFPSWSPNGRRIAYGSYDGNDFELATIKPDGTGRKLLTNNDLDDNQVDWSPTGRRIAYGSYDGTDDEIYTIKPDGSGVRQLTHNTTDDFDPSYSPSGRSVTYTGRDSAGHDQIFVKRIGSVRRHQITHNRQPKSEPSWSPNGRRIAYIEVTGTGHFDIYTIKRGGGDKHRVTRTKRDEQGPEWGPRVVR